MIFARSIKESVFSPVLTAVRESKLDVDQAAASFCQQHNITMDKSKSEANIKKLQTQALAEWVAQQLKQFTPPEDPPVSIPQSPSSTKRKTTPSSSTQPTSKKQKPAFPTTDANPTPSPAKAPPTDFLTKALTFDGSPVQRTLATNAPASATPGAINKWIEKLHLDKKVKLQLDRAIKGISKAIKDIPKDEQAQIQDQAAAYGLPVSMAAKAKNSELVKIICAAIALAE